MTSRSTEHVEAQNTYGLPEGEPIASALRRWFRAQRRAVLALVPRDGAPLPMHLVRLQDRAWVDPMAHEMVPLLRPYWSRAYRAESARLSKRRAIGDVEVVLNPHLRAQIERQSFNFCKSTNERTSRRLEEALEALKLEFVHGMVERGETGNELADRVNQIFDGLTERHAATIAATEASRAHHAAQVEAALESGVVAGKELLISADACDVCVMIATESKRVRLDQPFAIVGDHPEYSTVMYPPLHPNCCLPETMVMAEGAVSGLVVQYNGPVVRITMEDGSRFSVTRNHHFLTPTGFARAGQLMEGDDLICCSTLKWPTPAYKNNNWQPSRIDKTVKTLMERLGVNYAGRPIRAIDLHGDAAFCQGDVNVVAADRLLLYEVDAFRANPRSEPVFLLAGDRKVPFKPLSHLSDVLFAIRGATDGGVGSLRDAKSLLWRRGFHSEGHSFTASSHFDSAISEDAPYRHSTDTECFSDRVWRFSRKIESNDFGELRIEIDPIMNSFGLDSDWDSGKFQPIADSVWADTNSLSKVLKRFSSEVSTSKIRDIEFDHYSGPVYDIQTLSSLYLVGDGTSRVISGNCRCSMIDVLLPEYGGPVDPDWGLTIFHPEDEVKGGYEPPLGLSIPDPEPERLKEQAKPSGPNGRAVGDALILQDDQFGDKLSIAIRAIDSIHGDGNLPRIPVNSTLSPEYNGVFYAREQPLIGKRQSIEISVLGDHPNMTVIHEVGHFLDFNSGIGDREDMDYRPWPRDSAFSEWYKAILNSDSMKRLAELRKRAIEDGGRVNYYDYVMQIHEVWARSYAQYIVTKSDNPTMKAELDAIRSKVGHGIYPVQWSDDDFKPIELAIDDMFKKVGWIK